VGYAVVYDGAVAMRKPSAAEGGGGLIDYPWWPDLPRFAACGFAQIEFNETPVQQPRARYEDEPRRRGTYRVMLGEWCVVADALLEAHERVQHLIRYREWNGKKYLLYHAQVYQDDAGAEYVAESDFIESNDLTPLLRDVAQGSSNFGCFSADYPDELPRGEDLIRVGDEYCFRRGVYLQDLAQSLRTTPDPLQRAAKSPAPPHAQSGRSGQ